MSSRRTIMGLDGLEHWFEESVNPRNTIGLEFDAESIEEYDNSNGLSVWIRADSQLGKLLTHADVQAVLSRVSEELNQEEALRYQREANSLA